MRKQSLRRLFILARLLFPLGIVKPHPLANIAFRCIPLRASSEQLTDAPDAPSVSVRCGRDFRGRKVARRDAPQVDFETARKQNKAAMACFAFEDKKMTERSGIANKESWARASRDAKSAWICCSEARIASALLDEQKPATLELCRALSARKRLECCASHIRLAFLLSLTALRLSEANSGMTFGAGGYPYESRAEGRNERGAGVAMRNLLIAGVALAGITIFFCYFGVASSLDRYIWGSYVIGKIVGWNRRVEARQDDEGESAACIFQCQAECSASESNSPRALNFSRESGANRGRHRQGSSIELLLPRRAAEPALLTGCHCALWASLIFTLACSAVLLSLCILLLARRSAKMEARRRFSGVNSQFQAIFWIAMLGMVTIAWLALACCGAKLDSQRRQILRASASSSATQGDGSEPAQQNPLRNGG